MTIQEKRLLRNNHSAIERDEFYRSIEIIKESIKTNNNFTLTGWIFNEKIEKWERMQYIKIKEILNHDKIILWTLSYRLFITKEYIFLSNADCEIKMEWKKEG